MTSSMVMGSVLWMEGVGLGLARNIVQRYALKTGSEQGFGIGDKVAHDCVDRPDNAAFVECIISEQPAIMPRPIWPVLVPWPSLPAVPFCAKTGTIRPPRPAAGMAMLVSDAHAHSPLAVKRFPKAGSRMRNARDRATTGGGTLSSRRSMISPARRLLSPRRVERPRPPCCHPTPLRARSASRRTTRHR
jgi:hypothetical protein